MMGEAKGLAELDTKYIASFSGGKDSLATVILAHENKEPLDLILFAEVMFDKKISGELPEHMDFIKNKAIPLFNEWGYKTEILHGKKTYMDIFMAEPTKGKRKGSGMKVGFPMMGKCAVNKPCKIRPINDRIKQLGEVKQYVGIAADEPGRLEKLENTNKISLLAKYGYTEKMAFDLCSDYGLLSPIYKIAKRGGCWFCPNMRPCQVRNIRDNHPELWIKLLELEKEENLIGNIWNTLKKISVWELEEQYFWEEAQMTVYDFLGGGEAGKSQNDG